MVTRTTVAVVLAPRPGTNTEALEDALLAEATSIRCEGFDATVGISVPDAFAGTTHGAEVPDRISAILLVTSPKHTAPRALDPRSRSMGARLSSVADVQRSGLIVGTEHAVIPGAGPTMVVFALHRSPTLDHDQFSHYWLNTHGELARAHPRPGGVGYRQLHADPARTAEEARLAGFGVSGYDGLVSADFRDVDDMRSAFADPSVSEVALGDERRFIDHAASAIAFVRVI